MAVVNGWVLLGDGVAMKNAAVLVADGLITSVDQDVVEGVGVTVSPY